MNLRISPTKKARIRSILRRDNSLVPFDASKIYTAILKAFGATGEGTEKKAESITKAVHSHLLVRISDKPKTYIPHIEEIQDIVEYELADAGYKVTSAAYAAYRHEREKARALYRSISSRDRARTRESEAYFKSPLALYTFYRYFSNAAPGSESETVVQYSERILAKYCAGMPESYFSDSIGRARYAKYIRFIARQDLILIPDGAIIPQICYTSGILAADMLQSKPVDQAAFLTDMARYSARVGAQSVQTCSPGMMPHYPCAVLVRPYDTKKSIAEKITYALLLLQLQSPKSACISIPVYGYWQSRIIQDLDYLDALEKSLSQEHGVSIFIVCVFSHDAAHSIAGSWEKDCITTKAECVVREKNDQTLSRIARKDFLAHIHVRDADIVFGEIEIKGNKKNMVDMSMLSIHDQFRHFLKLYPRAVSQERIAIPFLFSLSIKKDEWIDLAAWLYKYPEYWRYIICVAAQ